MKLYDKDLDIDFVEIPVESKLEIDIGSSLLTSH